MKIGSKEPVLKDIEDADVMEQGTTYEAEEVVMVDEDEEMEPSKRTLLGSMGKTKSVLIVVGVIMVVVILFATMLTAKTASDKAAEERAAQLLAEEEAFYYTPADIELLRSNGYTGTEIESFEELGVPAQLKVDEAVLARERLYQEELVPILDGASDEYKELEAKTWLGGEAFELEEYDESDWSSRFRELNCNYEKIEPHGYQLWVMVSPHNLPDMRLFVSVSPETYDRMYDTGNVVVNVEYKYNSELGLTVITAVRDLQLSDN